MKLRPEWVVPAVACLVLGACGSNGATSSSSGESAQSSPAAASAEALVAKFSAVQPPVAVPRSTEPNPKEVRLAIQSFSNNPAAATTTDAAVAAAKALGWSVKVYFATLTPEGYQSTWKTMLQDNPTAIFANANFPNTLIAAQLEQAQARKIPIVTTAPYTTDAAPADGIRATVAGEPMRMVSGKLMAATVIADGKGPADVLYVFAPAFEGLLGPIGTTFTKEIEAAGGKVARLEIGAADIGQAIPGQVVNYLQRHPRIKYVAFVVSQVSSGVPQALSSSGLSDKVKLVSTVPQATDLAAIKGGQEFAAVADENAGAGWRAVDDLLRILTGQKNFDINAAGWHQILVKGNITQTKTVPQSSGIPDAYLKAWGVSGT